MYIPRFTDINLNADHNLNTLDVLNFVKLLRPVGCYVLLKILTTWLKSYMLAAGILIDEGDLNNTFFFTAIK